MVDIAVVGGGPAGLSAAKAASVSGEKDVVVLERGVARADREGIGPDSTDAAGYLDYWVELSGLGMDFFDDIILQELDSADFVSPESELRIDITSLEKRRGSTEYPRFGFTYDRVKADDKLRQQAVDAGADVRMGETVTGVTSYRYDDGVRHLLDMSDESVIDAEYLILADGPGRRVTMDALSQFLEGEQLDKIGPHRNHFAVQEYRRFPEDAFDTLENSIKFFWGYLPEDNAYLWMFPNRDRIVRLGLTRPSAIDFDGPDDAALITGDDDVRPADTVFLRRLLEQEYGDRYDIDADFPLLAERGKQDGTASYPISSMRPFESPVDANIAVTGGAAGMTSTFHEGGHPQAVRSGYIAGKLAAEDRLTEYNEVWKSKLGQEILTNIAYSEVIDGFTPQEWDHAFTAGQEVLDVLKRPRNVLKSHPRYFAEGLPYLHDYLNAKQKYRAGTDNYVAGVLGRHLLPWHHSEYDIVQITEEDFTYTVV